MSTSNATNSNPSPPLSQGSSEHDTPDEGSRRLEGLPAMGIVRGSEKLLRVVVRVSLPGDEIEHEYYREVLRSTDGTIHLARVYHAVDSDRNWVTDEESAERKPYITVEECGLKYALQRIKDFIPYYWRPEQNTNIEVLKCEPECRKAWQSITGDDDQTSDGLFPERLQFQTEET